MVSKTRPKSRTGENIRAVERQLQIQQALYEIADAASAVIDMQSFYRKLHDIVAKLMYAKNFFVALHDEQSDLITWPYYVDTVDIRPPAPIPVSEQRGATSWILRHGKTLADVDGSVARAMESGEIELVGTHSDGIGIPLKSDGKTIGVLIVQSYMANIRYTLQDMDILNFVAQHISTALARARAIDETRQRNAELAIINSVQEGLADQMDMQAIYELVGEKIRTTFNAQVVNIVTYDPATKMLHGQYYFEDGQVLPGVTLPSFGFRKQVIEKARAILINKDMSYWMAEYENPVVTGAQPKSAVFMPILLGEEAIGVISLQNNDQENAFSDSDVQLLGTLTSSMSVALENARLFGETQRLLKETEQRNAELSIINSVQAGLASQLDMQGIYELVGDTIRDIFDANTVALATFDLNQGLMYRRYIIERGVRYFAEAAPIPNIWMQFIQRGQSTLINENLLGFMRQLDPAFEVTVGAIPKSALSVPLRTQGEIRGVISLQNVDRENAFSQSDMRLLETLANSMSVALENAWLWEQEKLYRKALERELEIGREMQAGFLPEALPQVEGWEIAASLMSAREVAGDFYDAFELPDGNIGFVIADVCDKGVGAALFMTLFRSLIRITSNQEHFEQTGSVPHSVKARLQRAMTLTSNYIAETHQKSGMFSTLFFGILDPRMGTLLYINGGHEPPLIVQSGRVREPLCKTGPAVGALLDCHFDVGTAQLSPGEMLFAFTDGVPEARDLHGEFFGREQILHLLRENGGSAESLVQAVETELRRHMQGATQFDDITLLAVKRVH
jgi:serine phosphatase RsbU (regulator of sigma subunit)